MSFKLTLASAVAIASMVAPALSSAMTAAQWDAKHGFADAYASGALDQRLTEIYGADGLDRTAAVEVLKAYSACAKTPAQCYAPHRFIYR